MIPYNTIREHYYRFDKYIMEASKNNRWMDPYSIDLDLVKLMTPIEETTWHAIRCFGRLPLYPQYPIGPYFTDFANPYHMIVIECDGKAYHQDKEKDARRDKFIKEMGWTVYRVTGSKCFKKTQRESEEMYMESDEDAHEDHMKDFYENTMEGLLKALAIKHGIIKPYDEIEKSLAEQCLTIFNSPS